MADAEFLPVYIKLIPFFFSMGGVSFSFIIYYYITNFHLLKVNYIFIYIYNFFSKKWLFDFVYLHYLYKPFFYFSYFVTLKAIDRGILEFFGPLGLVRYFNRLSINLNRAQSGFVFHYIFFSMLAIMLLLFLFLFNGVGLQVYVAPEFFYLVVIIIVLLFNSLIKTR